MFAGTTVDKCWQTLAMHTEVMHPRADWHSALYVAYQRNVNGLFDFTCNELFGHKTGI